MMLRFNSLFHYRLDDDIAEQIFLKFLNCILNILQANKYLNKTTYVCDFWGVASISQYLILG